MDEKPGKPLQFDLNYLRPMSNSPRKPPFQFGLGSLLWLILVVAILIGWYRDRSRLTQEHEQTQVRAARQQAALRIQLSREQQNRRTQSWRVYRSMDEFNAPVSD